MKIIIKVGDREIVSHADVKIEEESVMMIFHGQLGEELVALAERDLISGLELKINMKEARPAQPEFSYGPEVPEVTEEWELDKITES